MVQHLFCRLLLSVGELSSQTRDHHLSSVSQQGQLSLPSLHGHE